MRPIAVVAVLLLLAGCNAPAGCAEWHCREGYEDDPAWRKATIPPDQGLEMDFSLKPGERLPWDWFQPQEKPLTFQMHYHDEVGRDVQLFQRQATDEKDSFVADEANLYSLFWINRHAEPVEVWIHVEGEQFYGLVYVPPE